MSDFTNKHYSVMYSLFEYKPYVHQYNIDGDIGVLRGNKDTISLDYLEPPKERKL